MDCWFWNIDRDRQDFFNRELKEGRLRQGWGYQENLDLREIERSIEEGEPLTDRQESAWSRCSDMLTRIAPGDLVVVKNVPSGDHFTVVRVTEGGYRFEISEETGDQGHTLPVQRIGAYNKNAGAVPTPMVRALNRERHPIRRTEAHHERVVNLAEVDPETAQQAEPFKEMVESCKDGLRSHLEEMLRKKLSPRRAERLVLEVLRNDGLDVKWTAGPNERGADLATKTMLGYGMSTNIAIQVKYHPGRESNPKVLDQIEQAFEERDVDAGLLVTFASELSEEVKERLTELKHKYRRNVEILYGEDLYMRLLELIADTDHTIEER